MKQNQIANYKDERQTLFDIVVDYTYALNTLDNYDYQRLTISDTTLEEQFHATYENAMEAINGLREKFGGSALFGNEKDFIRCAPKRHTFLVSLHREQ